MGDFNATYDHTPFRDFLGNRSSMRPGRRQAGSCSHGLRILIMCRPSPESITSCSALGMLARQVKSEKIDGSDHKALLATVQINSVQDRLSWF